MSDTIIINVNLTTSPITVNYQVARDAYQLAKAEGFVGTRPEWLASLNGTDGREIELQTSATHVQWRYQGTVGWTDLIALTAITGAPGQDGADSTVPGPDGDDGREVEFQSSGGYIQWRYVGEALWTNLVALAVITGPAGSDANVTTANVGTALAAAASKTPPVDADSIPMLDSADGNATKLLSFANLWAWIVTQLTAMANIDGLKTFLQNVVFNGTANRMPNQGNASLDAVVTRKTNAGIAPYKIYRKISAGAAWTTANVSGGGASSTSGGLQLYTTTALNSKAQVYATQMHLAGLGLSTGNGYSTIDWNMSEIWVDFLANITYAINSGNNKTNQVVRFALGDVGTDGIIRRYGGVGLRLYSGLSATDQEIRITHTMGLPYYGGTIIAATNASPIQITQNSHGFVTGNQVEIDGCVGNTAANGIFVVTRIDANNYLLNGSTGNGAWTSGGNSHLITDVLLTTTALNGKTARLFIHKTGGVWNFWLNDTTLIGSIPHAPLGVTGYGAIVITAKTLVAGTGSTNLYVYEVNYGAEN